MSNRTLYNGKIIASDAHEAAESDSIWCAGCAFEASPEFDVECVAHACLLGDFPEGHPLHHATNVIWIEKAAA